MWKKIDNPETFELLKTGNIICKNYADSKDQFRIERIEGGYVTAIHNNGYVDLRIVHEKNLLSGNWWVKI